MNTPSLKRGLNYFCKPLMRRLFAMLQSGPFKQLFPNYTPSRNDLKDEFKIYNLINVLYLAITISLKRGVERLVFAKTEKQRRPA